MRSLYGIVLMALVAVIITVTSMPAQAIPVYARKYGFSCTMCHSNFPRLNDFGIRYRDNGYRLPGRESDEKTVFELAQAPLALRTSAGFNSDHFKNVAGAQDVSQFQLNGVDVLSGGLLGDNVGYMVVFPPEIHGSRSVVAQNGTLEMANVVFSNVGSTWLNARVGRFEPAYAAFSAKRTLTVSPYEVYDFAFPANPNDTSLPFSDTQNGIELTGYGRCGFKYAAGWVSGSNTNSNNDTPTDFYLRGTQVFGRGEGETTGQRIGLTGYWGQARPATALPLASKRNVERYGIDASLNFSHVNLALQYLHGHDDRALWNTPSDVNWNGGFAQLTVMPATEFVGFARYDWVNTPTFLDQDITRWTIGGRYYVLDNLALHMEYSQRQQHQLGPLDAKENFFTVRLDFGF